MDRFLSRLPRRVRPRRIELALTAHNVGANNDMQLPDRRAWLPRGSDDKVRRNTGLRRWNGSFEVELGSSTVRYHQRIHWSAVPSGPNIE